MQLYGRCKLCGSHSGDFQGWESASPTAAYPAGAGTLQVLVNDCGWVSQLSVGVKWTGVLGFGSSQCCLSRKKPGCQAAHWCGLAARFVILVQVVDCAWRPRVLRPVVARQVLGWALASAQVSPPRAGVVVLVTPLPFQQECCGWLSVSPTQAQVASSLLAASTLKAAEQTGPEQPGGK